MSGELLRPVSAVAWELRGCWATGRRVALSLSSDADLARVEGHVRTVSPTDAFCVVGDWHVPLAVVLAVHLPSRVGDSTFRDGDGEWEGPVPSALRRDPRQTELDVRGGRSR